MRKGESSLEELWDHGCSCHLGRPPCGFCTTFDPDATLDENITRILELEPAEGALAAEPEDLEYFKKHKLQP